MNGRKKGLWGRLEDFVHIDEGRASRCPDRHYAKTRRKRTPIWSLGLGCVRVSCMGVCCRSARPPERWACGMRGEHSSITKRPPWPGRAGPGWPGQRRRASAAILGHPPRPPGQKHRKHSRKAAGPGRKRDGAKPGGNEGRAAAGRWQGSDKA